jgi:hypothetical protein
VLCDGDDAVAEHGANNNVPDSFTHNVVAHTSSDRRVLGASDRGVLRDIDWRSRKLHEPDSHPRGDG